MYRFKKERRDAQVAINGSRLVINADNIQDADVQKTIEGLLKFHPQLAENFEHGDPGEAYPADEVADNQAALDSGRTGPPAGVPADSVKDALAELPAEERDAAAEAAVSESKDDATSQSNKGSRNRK